MDLAQLRFCSYNFNSILLIIDESDIVDRSWYHVTNKRSLNCVMKSRLCDIRQPQTLVRAIVLRFAAHVSASRIIIRLNYYCPVIPILMVICGLLTLMRTITHTAIFKYRYRNRNLIFREMRCQESLLYFSARIY